MECLFRCPGAIEGTCPARARGPGKANGCGLSFLELGVILYLASDLVWATKIKAMAEDLGLAARPVRSLEMLEARLADSPVTAFIADLEKPEEALAMLARLRRAGAEATDGPARRVRTLAFAPHVAKDLMQRAREAGADEVLPRGAFDHHLADLLLKLAGR